jgi:hypothetical protein
VCHMNSNRRPNVALHLQVLHVGRELPVTITLQNIISKAFPEEAEARVAEIRGLAATAAAPAAAEVVTLPLFVMSTLLPGEKMALNVFEPRCARKVHQPYCCPPCCNSFSCCCCCRCCQNPVFKSIHSSALTAPYNC